MICIFLLINCFFFYFIGIFVYLNYLVFVKRKEILEIFVNGLKRMEYRGYDFVGGLRLNFICYVSLLMYFMLFVIFLIIFFGGIEYLVLIS